VAAFIFSIIALVLLLGAIFAYGKRRPLGTPLTWGESIVAALVVFATFFLAYGVVPHQWLAWADGGLKWRKDITGIPLGPFGTLLGKVMSKSNHIFSREKNVLWPNGVTFGGRGRVVIPKETTRDIIAATLYIIMLGIQIFLWTAWQKRGKKASQKAALEPTSSFGRPLVRKA
jgi:hypothetical protein